MKTPPVGLTPAQRKLIKPALVKVNEARKELARAVKAARVPPPDPGDPPTNPCTLCGCPNLIRETGRTIRGKCKRCGHGYHYHLQ
jgi:hypothetical protein